MAKVMSTANKSAGEKTKAVIPANGAGTLPETWF